MPTTVAGRTLPALRWSPERRWVRLCELCPCSVTCFHVGSMAKPDRASSDLFDIKIGWRRFADKGYFYTNGNASWTQVAVVRAHIALSLEAPRLSP